MRPLERSDLPAVVALYEEWSGDGHVRPPAPALRWFERLLLDHPWVDDELPSHVYADADGAIVGFHGSIPRRLRLDGRPLRAAVTGGLIVARRARGRGVGLALFERFLAGPQDLAVGDGAEDASRRLWVAAGGHASTHASLVWRRVLRPATATAASAWWQRRPRPAAAIARVAAGPADALVLRVPRARSRLAPPEVATTAEPLTPEGLTEHVGAYRLRPDYDPAHLRWLFGLFDRADGAETLVPRLVRGPDRQVVGWYVLAVSPDGTAHVLGLGGDVAPVVDHLLRASFELGATVVEGRLDPGLLEVLRPRHVTLHASSWTLLHARDPEVLAVLGTPEALMTRLDGNWWNGYLLWR